MKSNLNSELNETKIQLLIDYACLNQIFTKRQILNDINQIGEAMTDLMEDCAISMTDIDLLISKEIFIPYLRQQVANEAQTAQNDELTIHYPKIMQDIKNDLILESIHPKKNQLLDIAQIILENNLNISKGMTSKLTTSIPIMQI